MSGRELAPLLNWLSESTRADFSGRNFESRLRIQKTVYILGVLGEPSARQYSFGSYFYGPYSPTLARDYYGLQEHPESSAVSRFVPPRAAEVVLRAVEGGNDFLEAVATLHAFVQANPGASASDRKKYIETLKPRLSRYVQEALAFLEGAGLVRGHT